MRVERNREPGVTLEQIFVDFGVHPLTLSKWQIQPKAAPSTLGLTDSRRVALAERLNHI